MARSRRRSRLIGLPLLAVAAFLPAGPAWPLSSPPIPVDVPWSGTRPDRVELRGSAAPVPLAYKPDANRFQGDYPRPATIGAFEDVIMIGRWKNHDDRVLFLRISPDMRAVNLQLLRHAYPECKMTYVNPLQAQANDREGALEAYYRARALYLLDDENQCRGERKKAAAKAWLDRSFELAMTDCLFRLNPEAAGAYRRHDPAYVAKKEEAMLARGVQCKAQARNRLWSRGQYAEAFAVGDQLVQELGSNPELQAAASRYYAVSKAKFESEQGRLGSYLTKAAEWRLATLNAPSAAQDDSDQMVADIDVQEAAQSERPPS